MQALNETQSALLNAIFAFPFENKQRIIANSQLDKANILDPYGSLGFSTPNNDQPRGGYDAPITLAWNDEDGVPVELIVLVSCGAIAEICIYKVDGSNIIGAIDPSNLYLRDIPLTDDSGESLAR